MIGQLLPANLITHDFNFRLLEALNAQGMTLIVVTHDQALGTRARRQIKMEDGRIVSDVTGEAG